MEGANSQLRVLPPLVCHVTATVNHHSLFYPCDPCPVSTRVAHDAAGILVWLQILVRNPDGTVKGGQGRPFISATVLLPRRGGILLLVHQVL